MSDAARAKAREILGWMDYILPVDFQERVLPKIAADLDAFAAEQTARAEVATVERDGANEHVRMLLEAKNHWADRAQAAEAREGKLREEIGKQDIYIDSLRRVEAQVERLRAELDKVLAFDISPMFDSRGSYSERKSGELHALQAEIRALLAATDPPSGEPR